MLSAKCMTRRKDPNSARWLEMRIRHQRSVVGLFPGLRAVLPGSNVILGHGNFTTLD
jgi:hypothetical protein